MCHFPTVPSLGSSFESMYLHVACLYPWSAPDLCIRKRVPQDGSISHSFCHPFTLQQRQSTLMQTPYPLRSQPLFWPSLLDSLFFSKISVYPLEAQCYRQPFKHSDPELNISQTFTDLLNKIFCSLIGPLADMINFKTCKQKGNRNNVCNDRIHIYKISANEPNQKCNQIGFTKSCLLPRKLI